MAGALFMNIKTNDAPPHTTPLHPCGTYTSHLLLSQTPCVACSQRDDVSLRRVAAIASVRSDVPAFHRSRGDLSVLPCLQMMQESGEPKL